VRVKVLFFGQLRDVAGRSEDQIELPPDASVETVFRHYADRFPRLSELGPSVVVARNQQFTNASSPVSDGDEIAFLPPVSGGATPSVTSAYIREIADDAGHFFALTRDVINVGELKRLLLQGTDGAVVDFEGVVRNNTKGRPTLFLDYEGYESMAIGVMADIGREIARTHPIGRIAMVHRLGRLQIGETSVAVVVTAPHRRAAFDAALEGINRLKKMVPIWKREHFADGEVWVDGEWDDSVVQR
jgi:molybdopterin synthase catalytic subunit